MEVKGRITLPFILKYQKNHRKVTAELIGKHGDKFALQGLFHRLHFFTDPGFIEHVLFSNNLNYPRLPNPLIDTLEDPTNLLPKKGIFERWKKVRSAHLNPNMTESMVLKYIDVVFQGTEEHLPAWEAYANGKDPFPLYSLLQRLTLRNLKKGILGDVELDESHVIATIDTFDKLEVEYELSLTKLAWKFPTKTSRDTQAVMKHLSHISDIVIKHCLTPGTADVLNLKEIAKKYAAEYQLGEASEGLRNFQRHIMGLCLIVGFDSLSRALPIAFAHLSMFPEIADKIRQEVNSQIGDAPITSANVHALSYTRAVFLECMRYSGGIFPVIVRRAYADDAIQGYTVKKGDTIIIPVHYMTRLTEYWENPEGFNPNRFLGINVMDERYRFVYLVFGAGIRGCLGRHFAILQCTIIMAMVLKRYRLDLVPYQEINPDYPDTIRMTLHRL